MPVYDVWLAGRCRAEAEGFEKRAQGMKLMSKYVGNEIFQRDIEHLEFLARAFHRCEEEHRA
jgi:hypothetical protein